MTAGWGSHSTEGKESCPAPRVFFNSCEQATLGGTNASAAFSSVAKCAQLCSCITLRHLPNQSAFYNVLAYLCLLVCHKSDLSHDASAAFQDGWGFCSISKSVLDILEKKPRFPQSCRKLHIKSVCVTVANTLRLLKLFVKGLADILCWFSQWDFLIARWTLTPPIAWTASLEVEGFSVQPKARETGCWLKRAELWFRQTLTGLWPNVTIGENNPQWNE